MADTDFLFQTANPFAPTTGCLDRPEHVDEPALSPMMMSAFPMPPRRRSAWSSGESSCGSPASNITGAGKPERAQGDEGPGEGTEDELSDAMTTVQMLALERHFTTDSRKPSVKGRRALAGAVGLSDQHVAVSSFSPLPVFFLLAHLYSGGIPPTVRYPSLQD